MEMKQKKNTINKLTQKKTEKKIDVDELTWTEDWQW